jgi:glycerate dehydrogenase
MKGVILDADSLGDADLSPITSLLDHWAVYSNTSEMDIDKRVEAADVVLTNKINLSAKTIKNAKNLSYISILATGTNNVDLIAARDKAIAVSNSQGYSTASVVQHTLSLILNLVTQMPRYLSDVKTGLWQQSNVFTRLDHPISELDGKVLGIIGYGELGSNVARIAEAFGMRVLIAKRDATVFDTSRCSFEDLLPQVDVLSLHCPLTDANEHMINQDSLKLMKPTAFVINTARGKLVNSLDLISALEQGIIAGAGIDVLDSEPPQQDEVLTSAAARLDNLFVTPHNAWGARESRIRLIQQTRENILGYISGNMIRVVN